MQPPHYLTQGKISIILSTVTILIDLTQGEGRVLYRGYAEGELPWGELEGAWILVTPNERLAVRIERLEHVEGSTFLTIKPDCAEGGGYGP